MRLAVRLLESLPGLILLAGTLGFAQPALSEREIVLMGTVVELQGYSASPSEGLHRLEQLISVLEASENDWSIWREDTPLSDINREPIGNWVQLSDEMCRVFPNLLAWSSMTMGAFDPAIGRLIELWDLRGKGRVPGPEELTEALRLSGLRGVEFDHLSCRIRRQADLLIDSGGFGKGEALDRAFRRFGGRPWLIDLGGQIMAGAPPPDRSGWRVAIAHPSDRQRPALELELAFGSLATSSASERSVTAAGKTLHHILDPKTGQPAQYLGSVTVWSPSALTADVLATALAVMGVEQGVKWGEEHSIAVLFLFTAPQGNGWDARATTSFRRHFPAAGPK